MTEHITVIVVDDHTLFREGVVEMISSEPDIEVVGVGADGWEAIELAGRLHPDIALLDVEMPGPGSRAMIGDVRDVAAGTRSVMLTMHDDPGLIRELLAFGASAYLVKTIGRASLVAALRSISTLDLVQVTAGCLAADARTGQPSLTPRELEVLQHCALALSNGQIASRLDITEGTVKRHMTNIFGKLGAVSRLDAVRRAHAARLITIQGDGA